MDTSKEDLLKLTPAQWEARFAKQRRDYIAKNGPSASPVLDQLAIHGNTPTHTSRVKNHLKSIWNSIPTKHRPLAIAMLASIPFAFWIAGQFPTDEEYAAERAARASQTAQLAQQAKEAATQEAAQRAASKALADKVNAENRVRSECWQYIRRNAHNAGSVDGPESWINGDVTSDFVVIQPFTAENGFGARRSATAVCSGNGGVITSYEVDQR